MALVSDANMKALLKTVYLDGVYNSKFQASPIINAMPKESWGAGKELKYAAQVGNGGNFGSVYSTLVADPTVGAQNIEWVAEQGYLTGFFSINQPEMLTTADQRGAYMKALSNKMSACFDGISKTLATYFYGGKWGVIDQAKAEITATQANGNKLTITSAGALKLDVGSRFVVASEGAANTAKPNSNLLNGFFTVTSVDDETITFDASVPGQHIYIGDYIELYTARGADNTARGIDGLYDLIPAHFDRTGGDWNTYIGETFRGIDRSKYVSRLAGQFVKAEQNGDTRLTDALVSLLKKTKRAGGMNNIMVVNDETWDAIGAELGVQKNLWQATNYGNTDKNSVTAGLSQLATAFGDAFIGRTVIDPYCTEGLVYSFDKDDMRFYDLGNVSRITSPVGNDQLGKYGETNVDIGDEGFGDVIDAKINVDKLFNVEQGAAGEYGPSMRISANVFGNFITRKTASNGVAVVK